MAKYALCPRCHHLVTVGSTKVKLTDDMKLPPSAKGKNIKCATCKTGVDALVWGKWWAENGRMCSNA